MAPDVLRHTPHDAGLLDRTGIICASVPSPRGAFAEWDEPVEPAASSRMPRSAFAGMVAAALMMVVAVTAVLHHDLRPGGPVATDVPGNASDESAVPPSGPVRNVRAPACAAESPERRPGVDTVGSSRTKGGSDGAEDPDTQGAPGAPEPTRATSAPDPAGRAPLVVAVGEPPRPRFPVDVSFDEESRPTVRVDLPPSAVRPDESAPRMWSLLETMAERYVSPHVVSPDASHHEARRTEDGNDHSVHLPGGHRAEDHDHRAEDDSDPWRR